MIRRAATLLGMLSFACAWMVGVWLGRSPAARVESALIALVAGAAAGVGIGVAIEKIILARLAVRWNELESGAKPAAEPPAQSTQAARVARASSEASKPEMEAVR